MNHACPEHHRQVRGWDSGPVGQSDQAELMMLAVIAAVLAGAAVLFAFGNALGAQGAVPAGGRPRRNQRRTGDARSVPASLRAALHRAPVSRIPGILRTRSTASGLLPQRSEGLSGMASACTGAR
jgi:hypothetical protein